MKKCVVIGGGIAGLTSAIYLSKQGLNVELIESTNHLGGRAYSFKDDKTGSIIDNGQHILMGCYTETLKLFKIIGSEKNLIYQDRLSIPFLNSNGEEFKLEATKLFYPLNILMGLLNYKPLNFNEKISLLYFFFKMIISPNERLKHLTVNQWLNKEGQNDNIIKSFWEIVCVGALNTSTEKASAKLFADILKKIFLKGNFSSTIIISKYGLSETYCNSAKDFLEKNNTKISFSESVIDLQIENNCAKKITTNKRTIDGFDFVVSSVPLLSLLKFYKDDELTKIKFDNSCIVSIHIWLKKNKLTEKFYGFIDSPVHWIFNHSDHITLVISDANYLVEKDKTEVYEMCLIELKKYTNIEREDILEYKIIKEKRATFIPTNEVLSKRPNTRTKIKNLFLAGDWTNTGLPSTLEGAVKSGKTVADYILKKR